MDDAARLYPAAPRPWLDLSTGLNPRPWHPAAAISIDAGPLPGRDALRGLETAAAHYFRVDPTRVAAVPGSEIALRTLPLFDMPRPLVSLIPAYGTHGDVCDLSTCFEDLERHHSDNTLILANPNNPDGALLTVDQIHTLARRQAEHGGWLILDEAFADALPGSSILPTLDPQAPVIALRSFGKFFGLAGLRLGFVVAPEYVIAKVRRTFGRPATTLRALALGGAADADADWIAATRVALTARAAQLDALLARHGLVATGACPLFRLVDTPDAAALFDRLARAGILVRPFADRPNWLRFGLPGSDPAFARLGRALADG